ncbi:MAG: hypothetical protein ABIE94_03375 [archaeon]
MQGQRYLETRVGEYDGSVFELGQRCFWFAENGEYHEAGDMFYAYGTDAEGDYQLFLSRLDADHNNKLFLIVGSSRNERVLSLLEKCLENIPVEMTEPPQDIADIIFDTMLEKQHPVSEA